MSRFLLINVFCASALRTDVLNHAVHDGGLLNHYEKLTQESDARMKKAAEESAARQKAEQERKYTEDSIMEITQNFLKELPYGSIELLLEACKEKFGQSYIDNLFSGLFLKRDVNQFYEDGREAFRERIEEFQNIGQADGRNYTLLKSLGDWIKDLLARIPESEKQRLWRNIEFSDLTLFPEQIRNFADAAHKAYDQHKAMLITKQDQAKKFMELNQRMARAGLSNHMPHFPVDVHKYLPDELKSKVPQQLHYEHAQSTVYIGPSGKRYQREQIPLPHLDKSGYQFRSDFGISMQIPAEVPYSAEVLEQMRGERDNQFQLLCRTLLLVITLATDSVSLTGVGESPPIDLRFEQDIAVIEYKTALNLDGSEDTDVVSQRVVEWKDAQAQIIAAENEMLQRSNYKYFHQQMDAVGTFPYCVHAADGWVKWLHAMIQDHRIDTLLKAFIIGREPNRDEWYGLEDVRRMVRTMIPREFDANGIQKDYSSVLSEKFQDLWELGQSSVQYPEKYCEGETEFCGHVKALTPRSDPEATTCSFNRPPFNGRNQWRAFVAQFEDNRDRHGEMISPFSELMLKNFEKRCEFVCASRTLVEESLATFSEGRGDVKTSLTHFKHVQEDRNAYFLNFQRAIALVIVIVEQHLNNLQ